MSDQTASAKMLSKLMFRLLPAQVLLYMVGAVNGLVSSYFAANYVGVTAMGAERDIAIDLTPDVQVGDYVLVHAGFAIEVVDEQYAAETLELIKTMAELVDDPLFDEGAVA